MGLFKRTKILPTLSIIFIATTFLFLTPLLSSSLKSFSSTNYLVYLIINVLIITLGADAGLLSPSSPSNNKTPHHHHHQQQPPQEIDDEKSMNDNDDDHHHVKEEIHNNEKKHKCLDEKMMCPKMPPKTIFFIGSDENEEVKEVEVEVEVKEVIDEEKMVNEDDNEEEELFVKAEVFIGNFYKQLKMQREESWNRIHGFYSNGHS